MDEEYMKYIYIMLSYVLPKYTILICQVYLNKAGKTSLFILALFKGT